MRVVRFLHLVRISVLEYARGANLHALQKPARLSMGGLVCICVDMSLFPTPYA